MKIVDLRCTGCRREFVDQAVEGGPPYPACPECGRQRDWIPGGGMTFEWGGPRFYNGLDREFGSRSELLSYLKEHGLAQAPEAEKQGGARNENGQLGKSYSFARQGKRSSYSPDYGRRR